MVQLQLVCKFNVLRSVGRLYRQDILMYSIIRHGDVFSAEAMAGIIMLVTRWLDLLLV